MRKTSHDRIPVALDKLEIIKRKSRESGVSQIRIVDDLLAQAMRQRRWISVDAQPVEEAAAEVAQ